MVVNEMSLREISFASKFNHHVNGFEYSRGYENSDKDVYIRCAECNHETKRSCGFLRKVIRGEKSIACEKCEYIKKEREREDKRIMKLRNKILAKAIVPKSTLIEIKITKCKECGSYFRIGKSLLYCSKQCSNKSHNRNKEIKRRHKARDNGFVDYSIHLNKVIEKENNVCYLCNKECDSNDYYISEEGHYIVGPEYPTVEHVIPISKGGTHTWDNVKLAHHHCNTIKSDNPPGSFVF